MIPLRFRRRDLLKTVAGALLVAPILRQTEALAAGSPIKRFVALFHPNGCQYLGANSPNGPETGFSFGDYFQGLERHRDISLVLTGMRIGGEPWGTQAGSDGGHGSGTWGCLTCTSSKSTGNATGPSIDQFVAQQLADQGLAPYRRAPVFGVGSRSVAWNPFYESAGRPVFPTTSPTQAFDQLFAGFTPGNGSARAAALLARKKSILDTAYVDGKSSFAALPSEGRAQLDYHCDRIRDLENALTAVTPPVDLCTVPQAERTAIAGRNPNDPNNYEALTDFMFRLIETSFLCDVTRVAGFSFGDGANRFNMPWVNAPVLGSIDTGESNVNDHHSHTHGGTVQSVGLFMKWYTKKFAELLDRLRLARPDGSRLMDSTLLHWTTENGGAPSAHATWGLNMFLFGQMAGAFRTGRLLAYPINSEGPTTATAKTEAMRTHAMMVSIIQAMGITGVNQFGDPNGGSGPLAALS